jgi:hypothetical protein
MELVKTAEGIMEILAAYDLTESYRDAAKLAGCDHHTVAPARRAQILDAYREKVEEWVEASHGRVRADVAHGKLEALGYEGSERTTRRVVAEVKAAYRAGHRRRFRPWLPEPGLWLQWDYGDGPLVEGQKSWLFCAWLSWSRYRVVLPIRDKSLPTLLGCLDTTLRAFGGVPTYGLTDNEKPVTVEHIARIAVRHPTIVAFGRHYGLTIATCVVADPQSKGGSEATVRIASADLVPTLPPLRRAGRRQRSPRRRPGRCHDQLQVIRPPRGGDPNESRSARRARCARLPRVRSSGLVSVTHVTHSPPLAERRLPADPTDGRGDLVAAAGEFAWPRAGRFAGRLRGILNGH